MVRIDDIKKRITSLNPTLIASIVVLLGFGVLITGLWFGGRISTAQASLIATLTLVGITGFYAVSTYLLVKETQRSREQEIRPVLDFQAQPIYSYIVNIGGGPARKLDVTLELLPAGEKHRIHRQSLQAGGQLAIHVEPFSSIADRDFMDLQTEGLREQDIELPESEEEAQEFWENQEHPYQKLVLRGSCKNMWGNDCEFEVEYDVFILTQEYGGGVPPYSPKGLSLQRIATEMHQLRLQFDDSLPTEKMKEVKEQYDDLDDRK